MDFERSPIVRSLSLVALVSLCGCPAGDIEDDTFTTFTSLPTTTAPTTTLGEETGTSSGDGDGDPATGDGDGEPAGDGDGDPTTSGDGDGDPTTTGDGDGEPPMPTCDDNIQNQDETDVDCGGDICEPCADGLMCVMGSDCQSTTCDNGVCVAPCLGDVDCDYLDGPCLQGICNIGICEQFPANPGGDCTNDEICMANGQCVDGVCVETPLDCTEFDSDCTMGFCDMDSGECAVENINEGMPCAGAVGCTSNPVCGDGVCDDPNGGALFYEDFADNSAGWTLETNWAIGATFAGCGDPATDHSPTDDNGVAGVVLGGCAPTVIHPDYCLVSPVIDTAGLGEVWMTYYRHLWSDYTPYMQNTLSVYNGNSWVILYQTQGSPGIDDGMWTYRPFDVSAYANANMQFRWCYNIGSNGVFSRGSWNVDDVTVAASECNGADEE